MDFTDSTIWLIQTFFTIYLIVLWLRILLPSTHTSSLNPIAILVRRLSNFIIEPIYKIVPHVKYIDYVTLIILFLVDLIQLYLVGYLQTGQLLNFFAICLWSVAQILSLLFSIFICSIILCVLLSWMSIFKHRYYPLQEVLEHLSAPMLKPIQSVIPIVGRLDFSPIIALLMLFAVEYLLFGPMVKYAILLAFNSSVDVV